MAYARKTGPEDTTVMFQAATLAQLTEEIVSQYTVDAWFEDSIINEIADTNPFQILSQGGTSVVFKRYGNAEVADYTENTDITYSNATAESVTLDLSYAAMGAYTLGDIDKISVQNVDKEGLKRIARKLMIAHEQNHYEDLMAYLLAQVIAGTVKSDPNGLSGLFYKANPNQRTYRTSILPTGDLTEADARYILEPFEKARTARKRQNVPKGAKMYALVPPELFELIEKAEQFHYIIDGTGKKVAENTAGSRLMIKGFEVIEVNTLDVETERVYEGTTYYDQAPIVFGCKQGLAFYPQFEKTEMLRLEKRFADAVRQLSLYGMGFSDNRFFGVDWMALS